MYKHICLILLLSSVIFSNECVIVFGRNDEVVNVQAENISMREEEIIIMLHRDYYEVDVTFDFFNSGSARNVQLGFPIEGAFYEFSDDDVYDFKTSINNKAIPVHTTRRESSRAGGVDKHIKWLIRDATFPANSRTVSKVTYKARYSVCGGLTTAGYIYGTGRFWKGGIGKMTLIVNHGDDLLVDEINFWGHKDTDAELSEFLWKADGKYKYVLKNVKPRNQNASIAIFVQPFDYGLYGKYNDEFGVKPLNARGGHIDEYHYDYWWDWGEYLLYKNPTDIQHYTKNQVRLFINFFFAIHGYDFKNPLYSEYFKRIENFGDKNQTKYKVNPNFKESNFNKIERKNIDYLLYLEKMIP